MSTDDLKNNDCMTPRVCDATDAAIDIRIPTVINTGDEGHANADCVDGDDEDDTHEDSKTTGLDTEKDVPSGVASFQCSSDSGVRFGCVEIHEHDLELGGSVPLRGPSLSLGWNRASYKKFDSVEQHQNRTTGHKSLGDLHQPAEQRTDILLALGYSFREIQASIRQNGVARTQRKQSARYSARSNAALKAVRKMIRPLFSSKRSVDELVGCDDQASTRFSSRIFSSNPRAHAYNIEKDANLVKVQG